MLTSVETVVEALGGAASVARSFGVGTNTVSMWRIRGRIPPGYFLPVQSALAKRSKSVDPAVFGMRPLEEAR